MTERSEDRKRFLHEIFTTAIEGGINYWAEVEKYHHSNPDGSDDLDGFSAVIREEGEYEWLIDADVIARGVSLICQCQDWVRDDRYSDPIVSGGQVKYLTKSVAHIVHHASLANDSCPDEGDDIDASIADVIVQVGLFGEVVYG